jgi:hypothetical protein
MTEMAEMLAVLLDFLEEGIKCEFPEDKDEWTCTLDGNSDTLAQNITKHMGIAKPKVPSKLADVSPSTWPSQAHHLVPWQQLKKHPVTQWLAMSKKRLLRDNDYSVDHGHNGKFMPYASDLREWSGSSAAKKRRIAERVMTVAGIQLHQGPHSYKPYGVGEDGYKTRVAEYLEKINGSSLDHYTKDPPCKDCKVKSQGGKKSPRRNVVLYMDAASRFLDLDINAGRVYVSRRAADFVEGGGVLGDDQDDDA